MREIKTDHWVRTADGSIGRVRYVHEQIREADVAIDNDWNNTVTLPIGELRRVADPTNKRPAIENMPPDSERPRCELCRCRLRPRVKNIFATTLGGASQRITRRVFEGWEGIDGVFHSNTCAIKFARKAFKAGYRIVR